MPREVEHTPDETALLNKFARLKGLQDSASASKQAAVESDEEARRRRRELAVKALKKSLAQQEALTKRDEGDLVDSRNLNTAEQARVAGNQPVSHETAEATKAVVRPQPSQKEQGSAAGGAVLRSMQSASNFGMKRKPVQENCSRNVKPHRLFPGKEEVVYEDI